MKRILALMKRDTGAGVRDFILIYGLVAPFLLALAIRAFIPVVGSSSVTLVVTSDIGQSMVDRLEDYAKVEVVDDRAALDRRVLALDDAVGVVAVNEAGSPTTYRVVLQGNEAHDAATLPGVILADITRESPVSVTREDLGRVASPIKPVLAIVLAMTAMLIGGMVIGFNIIEDKETSTISALAVTPLSGREYVGGRSLLGLVLTLVLVVGSLYLMGAGPFSLPQVLVVTIAGAGLAVIFGFYVGAVSQNQIAGIAAFKFGSVLFLVGPILAAVLPAKWQLTLYWLPTYWTYLGYQEIFQAGGASWGAIWRLSAVSLGVSLVFLAVLWQLLSRKLALRG